MSHGTTTINPGMMPGTFGDDPADMGGANVNSNIAGSITLFVMFASVAALGLGADAQRHADCVYLPISLLPLESLSGSRDSRHSVLLGEHGSITTLHYSDFGVCLL